MAEFNAAFLHCQVLLFCVVIVQVRFLFQHFTDALCARHCPGRHHKQEGNHDQGRQDLNHVVDKRGQVANGHLAVQHQRVALPGHPDHRDIHHQCRDRLHLDHDPHGAHRRIFQVAIGFAEFMDFIFFPYKGFHHPHIGDVFLHGGVQSVHFGLHFLEARESGQDVSAHKQKQRRNTDPEDRRQVRPQADRHDQAADHHARGPQCHPHQHCHKVLHLRHVIGHPRHKGAGGKPVNIAERESLDLAVQVVTDIPRKGNARL